MKIEHSFAWALRAGGFAAAAILAPQVAQASPHLTASYAGTPYTLAASCDPNQPVLFIHLTLGNTGDTPTPSHKVTANEPAGSLAGEADLAAIAPGTSVDFTLPVRLTTSNSIAFVGDHTVAASAGPRHLAPLHFSVPMSLCAPTPAPAPPQVGIPFTGGATQAPNFRQQLTAKVTQVPPALPAPAASATVSPFLHRSLTAVAQKSFAISALDRTVPANLKLVQNATDCDGHGTADWVSTCRYHFVLGDFVMVWDAAVPAAGEQILGYRLYFVDSTGKKLYQATDTRDGADLTIKIIMKPYIVNFRGKCLAVSANKDSGESALGAPMCTHT